MNKLITTILLCFTIFISKAQTNVNSYNVNDSIWEKSNSPYYITGQITIPAGKTLKIEPGVKVIFKGNYSITVNGFIDCKGTATNKIEFKGDSLDVNTFIYWGYLNIQNPISGSEKEFKIQYCLFKFGTGIKVVGNTKNSINNCEFYNNYSCFETNTNSGASIDSIVDCKFMNNQIVFNYYKVDKTSLIKCDINKNDVFNVAQQRRFNEIIDTKIVDNGITTFSVVKMERSTLQKCSCYKLSPLGTNCDNLRITVDEMKNCYLANFMNFNYSLIINKEISNSVVRGLKIGVIASGTSNKPTIIHNNRILDNEIGIQLNSSNNNANSVTCNEINFNSIGLVFSKNQMDYVKNNTFCNLQYDAVNTSSQPQNLTQNYFCADNIGYYKENTLYDRDDSSLLGAINYNVYNSSTKQTILKVVAKDKSILTQADTTLPIDTACMSKLNWLEIDLNTNDTVCVKINSVYIAVNPTVKSMLSDNNNISLTRISGNVNTLVMGLYKEVYRAVDEYNNSVMKTRYVYVKPECTSSLEIILNTKDTICVQQNSSYTPVPPTAKSAIFNGSQLSLSLIFSNVDINVSGFYYEEYKAVDAAGAIVNKRRYVIVKKDCGSNVSISKIALKNNIIKLYPNPVNSILTIEVLNGLETEFKLIDAQGKEVWNSQSSSKTMRIIDVENLSNGIYFLVAKNNNTIFTEKILIQH